MKKQVSTKYKRGIALEMALVFMLVVTLLSIAFIALSAYTQTDADEYIRNFEHRDKADEIARDYVDFTSRGLDWSMIRQDGFEKNNPMLKIQCYTYGENEWGIVIKLEQTITYEALYDNSGTLISAETTQKVHKKLLSVRLCREMRDGDTEEKYYISEWNYHF